MQIIYVIGGASPEYEGWLQVGKMKTNLLKLNSKPNSDNLRKLISNYVDGYMHPAGQKYHLYWVESNDQSLSDLYHQCQKDGLPRYDHSGWFNTDVWTIRRILRGHALITNYRRLKPMALAKYLNKKYQQELMNVLKYPHNSREQRFKRDFYNTWHLSSIDQESLRRIIKMFSAFMLLRNLVRTVPKGCRKMFRKLVPLNIDDLCYDQKLLIYKFHLSKIIHIKYDINTLPDKPFGTAELTSQYLDCHVKFLKIFNQNLLKRDFNL